MNLASAAVLLVVNCAIRRWSMVLRHLTILVVNLWHLRGLCRTGRIQRASRLQTTLDGARPNGWYTAPGETEAPQPSMKATE